MKVSISKKMSKALDKEIESRVKAFKLYVAFIEKVLKKFNKVEFNTEYDNENITIAYDGGRHPEYASTMCATVYSVYKDEDSIMVECEDGDMCIDDVLFDDLITIAEAIEAHFKNLEE